MGIRLSESVVKPFVWWGCYDVVFFPASAPRLLIGLSSNPEKDLPLKNTSMHATGSIKLKLNLVARQGH